MCFLFKVRQSRKSLGKSNNICFSPADSDVIFFALFPFHNHKKTTYFLLYNSSISLQSSVIIRHEQRTVIGDLSANIASFPSSHNYSLLQLNFLAKSGIPFHFMKWKGMPLFIVCSIFKTVLKTSLMHLNHLHFQCHVH